MSAGTEEEEEEDEGKKKQDEGKKVGEVRRGQGRTRDPLLNERAMMQ